MTVADARRIAEMHAVYRMYDDRGRLLYVGVTGDIGQRFGDHSMKRWFPLVERITLEWHETRAQAVLAESRAIAKERPRYNIAGTPELAKLRRRAAPRTSKAPALPPGTLVTLREAVRRGILPGLTLAAVRKCTDRDEGFPEPAGRQGTALVYDASALSAWAANRKRPRHERLTDAQSASA